MLSFKDFFKPFLSLWGWFGLHISFMQATGYKQIALKM